MPPSVPNQSCTWITSTSPRSERFATQVLYPSVAFQNGLPGTFPAQYAAGTHSASHVPANPGIGG